MFHLFGKASQKLQSQHVPCFRFYNFVLSKASILPHRSFPIKGMVIHVNYDQGEGRETLKME
jgi:hypothetical protein